MPVQSTDIDNQGDGFDFSASDQFYTIDGGVTVQSEGASAVVDGSHGDDRITNQGQIVGGSAGVSSSATSDYLVNGVDGMVVGGAFGVETFSDYFTTINYGSISGGAAGEQDENGGATIDNFGSISGQDGIFSDSTGSAGDETIYNKGTITGVYGLFLDGESSENTVDNFGLIRGSTDAIFSSSDTSLKLTNRGVLDGDVSLDQDTGADAVANTGSIDGNVQLGNGKNTFDSRHGGAVDGTITGGSGADTIYLGNDGETVNGGAGHDVIYGGAGADTFAFTSVLAVDTDRIVGFNVAADRIQLNHAEFAGLKAGATPVFSIGASPTSASDHLYYNSTTGWLYYDADGTGSKPSHGFANLGAGLKLTAKDFTVV